MALGFVSGGGGVFRWFGDKIKAQIDTYLDRKMHQAGEAIVARAQALAPVRTGALRNSIAYVVAYNEAGGRHTLSIQVGVPYGVYQEFGTRNMAPHPYIRPALNEIGRIWGFDTQMFFAGTGYNPAMAGPWHGLVATTGGGRRKAGFAASAHPGWKPLTAKQAHHVEHVLKPSIQKHHRGNVKRSKLYVG